MFEDCVINVGKKKMYIPLLLAVRSLKTLKNLRHHLRNCFEGLQLNEDASLEKESRELKDAVMDASRKKRVIVIGTGSLVERLR